MGRSFEAGPIVAIIFVLRCIRIPFRPVSSIVGLGDVTFDQAPTFRSHKKLQMGSPLLLHPSIVVWSKLAGPTAK
jgi:xanthosine utilization system XapX-like protein